MRAQLVCGLFMDRWIFEGFRWLLTGYPRSSKSMARLLELRTIYPQNRRIIA